MISEPQKGGFREWTNGIRGTLKTCAGSVPSCARKSTPGMKAADLLEEIKQNAAESYTLMQQSNAILDEVIFSRRAENLTEEEAAGLSEFAGKLFNYANSEDCGIAYKIHALLLDYARLKQDDRAIIRELYWAGVTMHYMNVRSDDSSINPLGKQVRGYFQEGASYMARYEGFDLETKSYIIRCLGNSRMAMVPPQPCRLRSLHGSVRQGHEGHPLALLPQAGPLHPLG